MSHRSIAEVWRLAKRDHEIQGHWAELYGAEVSPDLIDHGRLPAEARSGNLYDQRRAQCPDLSKV